MDQTDSISVVAPINWVIITFGKNYLLFLSLIAVFDLLVIHVNSASFTFVMMRPVV